MMHVLGDQKVGRFAVEFDVANFADLANAREGRLEPDQVHHRLITVRRARRRRVDERRPWRRRQRQPGHAGVGNPVRLFGCVELAFEVDLEGGELRECQPEGAQRADLQEIAPGNSVARGDGAVSGYFKHGLGPSKHGCTG